MVKKEEFNEQEEFAEDIKEKKVVMFQPEFKKSIIPATVTATRGLKVRKEPSRLSHMVYELPFLSTVEIIERVNDEWIEIQYDKNKRGFVMAQHLSA